MIKLHLQSTNKRLDKICKDMIEVTKSLEFTQTMLNEELGTAKNDIKKLASGMKELENDILDPNEVSEKLIELEDKSQRKNLHVDGLIENTKETWNNCKKKLEDVLPDKLNIQDDIEFDQYERMERGEDLVHGKLSAGFSILKTIRRYCKTPRN